MATTTREQLTSLATTSALFSAALYSLPKLTEVLPAQYAEKVPLGKKAIQVFFALSVLRHLSRLAFSPKVDRSWDWKTPGKEIVVVTGGSSGIGELLVKTLAEKGITVVALDLNPPKYTLGPNAHYFHIDVTSIPSITAAAQEIRAKLGEPTVLVNNAGVGFGESILDASEEQIRKTVDVNVVSHFFTVREFLPSMIKNNHGHVVTIASMASFVTIARNVDYSVSKAGVLAFHEGLRQELDHKYGAKNVRTSVVHPIWVKTPLIESLNKLPGDIIEAKDVVNPVVAQILSGQGAQIFCPGKLSLASGIRGYPTWLQEKIRGRSSKVYLSNWEA